MPALSQARFSSLLTSSVLTLALALGLALVIEQFRVVPALPAAVERRVARDTRSPGERLVEQAQTQLASAPDRSAALTALTQAYLLRARETGDPAYYTRADSLVRQSLAARPDDSDTLVAAGSLALARHDFASAEELGRRVVALTPTRPAAYGLLADALVELGRYPEAIETTQRMVNLRPDLASYTRMSYLRELHGDLPGAIEAMQLALSAAAPTGEATAWTEVQLGNLLFTRGDLSEAQRTFESATRRVDDYVYGLAGLARVRVARGDLNGAAALLERAAARSPLPEFVIALGDTYASRGDTVRAEQQYALVADMQQLFAANGVRTNLELALFNADHQRDLEAALEAARAEYNIRPSVQVADTLAWVEYQSGDLAGASRHSREALRLGTRDPNMLYRAGLIALAAGEPDRAYERLKAASDLNPRYSVLYADDLAARLSQLAAGRS